MLTREMRDDNFAVNQGRLKAHGAYSKAQQAKYATDAVWRARDTRRAKERAVESLFFQLYREEDKGVVEVKAFHIEDTEPIPFCEECGKEIAYDQTCGC
jgi:hypothetical protein